MTAELNVNWSFIWFSDHHYLPILMLFWLSCVLLSSWAECQISEEAHHSSFHIYFWKRKKKKPNPNQWVKLLQLLDIFSRHCLKMTSQFQEGYVITGFLTTVSKQYLHIKVPLDTILWGKLQYTLCVSISFSYLSKYSCEKLGAELEISMIWMNFFIYSIY